MNATPETEAIIREMVDKIVAGYAPERVILFGSYAWGAPHADSDVDLFIVKDTDERFIKRGVAVRRMLSDMKRRLPMDVIVLTPQEVHERLAIGDQFIGQIIHDGEVLYAAERVVVLG